MRKNKLLLFALFLGSFSCLIAREPATRNKPKPPTGGEVQYRAVCANSTAARDQAINNVRARLLAGGDCWWDFSDGRYIVPKVETGSGALEVSSLYAGAVWLGGVDPGNNLKLACQDYRSDGRNDFWPGPLSTVGITESQECENWDRHFVVTGVNIRETIQKFAEGTLTEANLHPELKKWPARGNPFFLQEAGFPLPNTPQGLASFFDKNEDGLYNPLDGDYPAIDIRGCPVEQYPDEMIFWIYNDHGGGAPHARTGGAAIQMEIQVQAFAYTTGDELNDMTFQRYKLINRATEDIDSCFFSMWADPDLGCSEDDFIGCDSAQSLMYVYNQDAQDGNNGVTCTQGVATYGNNVPILGIDYFRGPLDEDGEEIGMSSFNFRNRQGAGVWPNNTYDPGAPGEYYNALNGRWNDNEELTLGGDGTGAGTPTNYAFPDAPDDATGWSMCTANLGFGDRRTLQTSGPFLLRPSAINELIIGIPWVPNITYPCPNLTDLFRADLLAQGLFDNCFDILDGPDAPDLGFVELNREIVAVLQNYDQPEQTYDTKEELPFNAPPDLSKDQKQYRFQGYILYQLANPNVSAADYGNTDLARPVAQVDLKDSITVMYNWTESKNPLNPTQTIYTPVAYLQGAENKGIRHTFSLKEDLFSLANSKGLINHKKYYYSIISYAHNNYADFIPTPLPASGQAQVYLPGRLNIQIYTVIPRPVVDVALQAQYGSGVAITRVEGVGAGGNFLDLTDESRNKTIDSNFDGELTYKEGRGPFTVTIFNPFEVKDGEYEVRVKDNTPDNNTLDANARWELVNTTTNEVVLSEYTLARFNEQVVGQYGFTITLAQTEDSGTKFDETNGAIGLEVEYADPNKPNWIVGQPDRNDFQQINYLVTGPLEQDEDIDNKEGLSRIGEGWMVPFKLTNWRFGGATTPYITPAWMSSSQSISSHGTPQARRDSLKRLPNIDIVFTKDTSKWSRCVVVETANHYYVTPDILSTFPPFFINNNYVTEGPNMEPGQQGSWRKMFDTRFSPSVGKNGLPNGSVNPDGTPEYGRGWFPGYAVDVETGRRLNIFFGENSVYSSALKSTYTGRDMLFNPTDEYFTDDPSLDEVPLASRPFHHLLLGGQHMIYVTNETYDGCEFAFKQFTNPVLTEKRKAAKEIQWCGIIAATPGSKMLSAAEGLIPNDCVVKVRVQNPYQVVNNPSNDGQDYDTRGYPYYRFKIENKGRKDLAGVQIDNALDSILLVPNPYYGFSQYEASRFSNVVKVTNLPAKCTVTIYTIDGKFIRQYVRNETYSAYNQITPALEWDLKNNKGIPVSSGVYLFHIDAGTLGERTVKWFGINRRFDPSGL